MFVHLHNHTEYSLLDGMSKMSSMVAKVVELGQNAVAVTDHGNLHGALEFYRSARSAGIKPIIGIEAYVAHGVMSDRNPRERQPNHLTILAQNLEGYKNLLELTSKAHSEGFYQKPRIDRELLKDKSEGLIVLSGCPSGELMSAVIRGDQEEALRVANWYREVFPDRYYIEIMNHGIEKFAKPTEELIALAEDLGLPPVLTNDSHYTLESDGHAHEALLCIGTNSTINDPKRMKFDSHDFYLRSEDEMRALFPHLPEAADNTQEIADSVDLDLSFGRLELPNPGIPEHISPRDHLRNIAFEGLKLQYSEVTSAHQERLKYELSVIEQTGFDEYMLIVKDIAEYARSQQIRMGVRGSAASSIVLYCLGVTDVDPIKWGLVFERFLNPERIGMPDVDFDFADDRRSEIIEYTVNKYGRDKVAQIGTFGTMGARGSIRDTARVLGFAPGVGDRLAKLVPSAVNTTLEIALKNSELGSVYAQENETKEIVDLARRLEGVARHASTHAAGIVISKDPLLEVVPMQRPDPSTGFSISQWGMDDIADVGLLKIDYLGLTNLTILGKALEIIEVTRGEKVDLSKIPDHDLETSEMMTKGHTFGVFQMEGAGMTEASRLLEPSGISDMAALVALYRPGPMEHIPKFADAKKGLETPYYLHPDLEEILGETYGVITYQEQVLQIARKFAGYSLGQADVMRKAMGKKIPEVMIKERESFLAGLAEQGHDRRLGEKLFDLIEPFAGYAFNKAHAVCYGLIAYQTAFLKAHYPIEYMAAVLCSSAGDRTSSAAAECQRLGIEIALPDVNRSEVNFSVELGANTERIRYGLGQIKDVGALTAELIVEERKENGEYSSMEDFAARVPGKSANKRVLEALTKGGAFDSLASRGVVVQNIERIIDLSKQARKLRETGQTAMFDMMVSESPHGLGRLDDSDPMRIPSKQIQLWEREYLGTYITDHPLSEAQTSLGVFCTHPISEIGANLSGQEVVVGGLITEVRELVAKSSNKPFAAIRIEDFTGSSEIMIWNKEYEHYSRGNLLSEGNIILARAEVRTNRTGRTTTAVKRIVGWDHEHKRLGPNFNEQQFRIGLSSGIRVREYRNRASTQFSTVGPSSDDTGNKDERRSEPLRDAGLLIRMDETRDLPADIRRLKSVFDVLDECPGAYSVTLRIHAQNNSVSDISRAGIDDKKLVDMLPRLESLLGVLGAVECSDLDITASSAESTELKAVGSI